MAPGENQLPGRRGYIHERGQANTVGKIATHDYVALLQHIIYYHPCIYCLQPDKTYSDLISNLALDLLLALVRRFAPLAIAAAASAAEESS